MTVTNRCEVRKVKSSIICWRTTHPASPPRCPPRVPACPCPSRSQAPCSRPVGKPSLLTAIRRHFRPRSKSVNHITKVNIGCVHKLYSELGQSKALFTNGSERLGSYCGEKYGDTPGTPKSLKRLKIAASPKY